MIVSSAISHFHNSTFPILPVFDTWPNNDLQRLQSIGFSFACGRGLSADVVWPFPFQDETFCCVKKARLISEYSKVMRSRTPQITSSLLTIFLSLCELNSFLIRSSILGNKQTNSLRSMASGEQVMRGTTSGPFDMPCTGKRNQISSTSKASVFCLVSMVTWQARIS